MTPDFMTVEDGHTRSDEGGPLVAIVEDHALIGEGLVFALRRAGMAARLVPPTSPEDVVAEVAKDRPNVVLLDLGLGGGVGDGAVLVAPLAKLGFPVIVVTASTDPVALAECLARGAVAITSKSRSFDELLACVEKAARGEPAMAVAAREELLHQARRQRAVHAADRAVFDTLTRREQEVLSGLMDGRSAAELAASGFVSLATVRSQIQAILRKLGVNSQLAAVTEARRRGWDIHQSCR